MDPFFEVSSSDSSCEEKAGVQQRPPLDPPIEKLENADQNMAYDAFVNACYHSNDSARAMRQTLREFKRVGITKKQISQFISRAKAKGIPVPKLNSECRTSKKELEKVVIEADSKYARYGKMANDENPLRNKDEPVLQNMADKFGAFIYDKKFNDGVVGAFGKGQDIQTSARGKLIILQVPRSYETQFKRQIMRRERYTLIGRILNSMDHYRKRGGGDVDIEYYDP